jgi:ATP-dependent helicase/nuclease subunit B
VKPLSEDNRPEAERLLKTISQAVFAQAVDENFEARSWLKQWLASIPAYLDWQRERERDWRVAATEQRLEHTWPDGMRMTGRADRIDARGNELAVLDYKTGATPRLADVEAGEAVQLPSYALLQDGHVTNTLYVRIDNGDIDSRVALEGEPLDTLVQANEQRLRALTAALKQGAGLSAWGDHKVCGYCDFDGLCRRQVWDDDADE